MIPESEALINGYEFIYSQLTVLDSGRVDAKSM
jgi:hypothetical protein